MENGALLRAKEINIIKGYPGIDVRRSAFSTRDATNWWLLCSTFLSIHGFHAQRRSFCLNPNLNPLHPSFTATIKFIIFVHISTRLYNNSKSRRTPALRKHPESSRSAAGAGQAPGQSPRPRFSFPLASTAFLAASTKTSSATADGPVQEKLSPTLARSRSLPALTGRSTSVRFLQQYQCNGFRRRQTVKSLRNAQEI